MKPWPLLVIGLGTILSISCSKGKFSEESATQSYEIKVVDPSGDATAVPGSTTASVEGPDIGNGTDSKDSASTGPESESETADSGKGGTDSGTDTADSGGKGGDSGTGGGTTGDDTVDSGKGPTKGSDKGSDKGGKGSSKGGSGNDAAECASVAGINKDRVKVSGNQKSITMSPQDAFALKVTGNQNAVHLKMTGNAGVSAICLFLAGNQSHVTMDIGVSVGRIFIKARGNRALVEGAVNKDGVIESLKVDANGNQPSIVMSGEGKYPCDQTAVTCPKP